MNDKSANQIRLTGEVEFIKKRPYSPPVIHPLVAQGIEGKPAINVAPEAHQVHSTTSAPVS